jgi:UDP:flavonoid glycosyltransferase YjiC (YdhE family)
MSKQTKPTILLCTIGSAGDVNPFIGIGQNLKKRGFRVVLITSQYFESQAHSAGLEFFGLGSSEDYQSIIQDPDLWSPDKGFKVFADRRLRSIRNNPGCPGTVLRGAHRA